MTSTVDDDLRTDPDAVGVRRRRPRRRAAARVGRAPAGEVPRLRAARAAGRRTTTASRAATGVELPHRRSAPRRMAAPGQTPHRHRRRRSRCAADRSRARASTTWPIDRIATAALYPTFGLMIQGVTEREPALALCRALNDWVAEYCAHDRERLIGVATLPMTNADDALAEARRCVEELGFRGVWRRPEHFGSLPRLQDEAYEPLWSYLEDVDVPFAIHPGMSGLVPYDELQSRFDDYFTPLHAAHFVTEQMIALTTFVAYGILERHPRLAGRVPRDRCRVGDVVRAPARRAPRAVRLRPRRAHDEAVRLLPPPVLRVGRGGRARAGRRCSREYPDSVVFSSDYPHADGIFPGSTKDLLETDELDDDDGPPRAARQRTPALRPRPRHPEHMDLFEAIYGLRATRVYDDRAIPDDVLTQILTAATTRVQLREHPAVGVRGRHRPGGQAPLAGRSCAAAWVGIDAATCAVGRAADRRRRPAGHRSRGHREHPARRRDRVRVLEPRPRHPDVRASTRRTPTARCRATRDIPGGRGSSLFPACQNMMLAAHALGVSSLFTTFFGLCERRGQGAAARAAAHVPRIGGLPRLRRRAARAAAPQAARRGRPPERLGACPSGPRR